MNIRNTRIALLVGLLALTGAASAATATLQQLPPDLVGAMGATMAREAAADPAYAIGANGCAKLGSGKALLHGCFDQQGPRFENGGDKLGLQLVGFGRGEKLNPVRLQRMKSDANRVTYRGKDVSEWWRVLPMGYEQGFTVEKAPEGNGPVVIALRASARPVVEGDSVRWGNVRYGKLLVTDAAGRKLPAHLTVDGAQLKLAFETRDARFPVTVDPVVWVEQKVTGTASEFGLSVALSSDGTTALVGAYGGETAYVFKKSGDTWAQSASLTATGSRSLGSAVALSSDGTVALIGAEDTGAGYGGAAYVFRNNGSGWGAPTRLSANLGDNAGIGHSVALSADGATALVGTAYADRGFVFSYSGGAWSSPKTLIVTGSYIGYSVALSGDGATALLGAPGDNVGTGAAYLFANSGGTWTQSHKFVASDGASTDYFGSSVALSADGTIALVGAYHKVSDTGAAYLYTKSTGWLETPLLAGDAASGDQFGWSVALSGDGTHALVGKPGLHGGAGYLFENNGGTWAKSARLTAVDVDVTGDFGCSVALSSDASILMVGASATNAAYFYSPFALSTALDAPPAVGQGARYSVDYTVTNTGVAQIGALQVQLPAPAGATYETSTATQGACGYANGVATCNLGALAAGATATTTLTVTATAGAGTPLTQSALVSNGATDLARTATIDVVSVPTISTTDLTLAAGTSGEANLTLGGSGTLTVKAVSTNTTLLPNSGIDATACTHSGACSISLTPAPWQSGVALVVVTVTNSAGWSTTGNFVLTVTAPAAPIVTGLTNIVVTRGNNGSETVTLGGTGPLTATITSGDTMLLPNANITPTAGCTAAGSCALTLTPAANQIGTTIVTVTVTDSYGQSGQGTFLFTVNAPAVPGAPTISNLGNLTVESGKSGTNTVTLTGNGPLTVSATSGDTTLLPNDAITGADACTASGRCTLTLKPSGKSGAVIVTVTATDGYGQRGQGVFLITVTDPASDGGSSGGGGGDLGLWELLLLGSLLLVRRDRGTNRHSVA